MGSGIQEANYRKFYRKPPDFGGYSALLCESFEGESSLKGSALFQVEKRQPEMGFGADSLGFGPSDVRKFLGR